jgi:hypothetical protein
VLDRGSFPSVRSDVLVFAGVSMVRIVFMAGFLKMVLQLFFCVASALTHRAHLLRRRRCVGMLVRPMIVHNLASILAHTKIVPPDTGIREGAVMLPPQRSTPDVQGRQRMTRPLPRPSELPEHLWVVSHPLSPVNTALRLSKLVSFRRNPSDGADILFVTRSVWAAADPPRWWPTGL